MMLCYKTHMLCYITLDYVMLYNTHDVVIKHISYITHDIYVI